MSNEWKLTPYELSKLKHNEWRDGRWYYDPYEISQAQAKKLVEYIREQAKYNLSAISQLDFFGSPMWQKLLKEVGLNT